MVKEKESRGSDGGGGGGGGWGLLREQITLQSIGDQHPLSLSLVFSTFLIHFL